MTFLPLHSAQWEYKKTEADNTPQLPIVEWIRLQQNAVQVSHFMNLIYEFSLQRSMLIYAYFSFKNLHFCYNKFTFVSSEIFIGKVHRNLIFNLWIFTLQTVFTGKITFANLRMSVYKVWRKWESAEHGIDKGKGPWPNKKSYRGNGRKCTSIHPMDSTMSHNPTQISLCIGLHPPLT
jgi:hypothetical protein